jgi:hypothetical protein
LKICRRWHKRDPRCAALRRNERGVLEYVHQRTRVAERAQLYHEAFAAAILDADRGAK